MSPWEIIWNVLGWIILAGIAIFVIAFIIDAIMVPFQRARRRRHLTNKLCRTANNAAPAQQSRPTKCGPFAYPGAAIVQPPQHLGVT